MKIERKKCVGLVFDYLMHDINKNKVNCATAGSLTIEFELAPWLFIKLRQINSLMHLFFFFSQKL